MSKKKGFLDGYKTYNPKKEGYGNANDWREAFQNRLGLEESERVLNGKDPLVILEIFETSPTWATIMSAYRKMALKFHPDKFHNDPEAAVQAGINFKRIQAAWEKLESVYKK